METEVQMKGRVKTCASRSTNGKGWATARDGGDLGTKVVGCQGEVNGHCTSKTEQWEVQKVKWGAKWRKRNRKDRSPMRWTE